MIALGDVDIRIISHSERNGLYTATIGVNKSLPLTSSMKHEGIDLIAYGLGINILAVEIYNREAIEMADNYYMVGFKIKNRKRGDHFEQKTIKEA